MAEGALTSVSMVLNPGGEKAGRFSLFKLWDERGEKTDLTVQSV